MEVQAERQTAKEHMMKTDQPRPFSAATSKLAYAQAFTKPALPSPTGSPAHRTDRRRLLASLRPRVHPWAHPRG